MSGFPSYDQHLLDRLNALKKSPIQIDSTNPTIPPRISTPESDLSSRLRSLRNGSLSPSPSPAPKRNSPALSTPRPPPAPVVEEQLDPILMTDDQTLEELLKDLGPEEQWKLEPEDPVEVRRVLEEARSTMAKPGKGREEEGKDERGKVGEEYLTRDLDMSVFTSEVEEPGDGEEEEEEGAEGLEGESREVRDIVRRLMDEVAVEGDDDNDHKSGNEKDDSEDTSASFSLPSAPSTQPLPPTKEDTDFTHDITTRLAALSTSNSPLNLPSAPNTITDSMGFPSAPTFKPSSKPTVELKKKVFSDEEIDSWCIICQDDATVKCLGCGGDLYCAGCWKEGHMGPDVGYEEKMHKWTKFRKPN